MTIVEDYELPLQSKRSYSSDLLFDGEYELEFVDRKCMRIPIFSNFTIRVNF